MPALLISKKQALLILVDSIGEKKEFFASYIAKYLPGDKVVLARLSDLVFDVKGKDILVIIDGYQEKLSNFNFVCFRRAGTKFLSLAGTVAVCLDYYQVPYVDTIYKNLGPSGDKFTSLIKLAIAGLPVIPTYFCWHTKINEKKEEIIKKIGLPLVAKQLSSQKGRGVLLLRESQDFARLEREFPQEEFLFQKYFESDKEYRILVLENEIGSFEEKLRVSKDEFRHNVALGAKEKFIDINKIPQDLKKMAITACQALNIQIGGVDVLIDKDGRPWLLEVNRGPGLTYDPKISPELESLAKYFVRKLEKR